LCSIESFALQSMPKVRSVAAHLCFYTTRENANAKSLCHFCFAIEQGSFKKCELYTICVADLQPTHYGLSVHSLCLWNSPIK
jgi:hypothetical protein